MKKLKIQKKSRKKKKQQQDVSIVSDTSSDEEEIRRGRGRPRKVNEKDKDDLINDIINETPELSEKEDSDDSDDELLAEIFNYTGNQSTYINMSLYIDCYGVVYNNLFEEIGTYNKDRNIIVDTI